MTQFLLTVPADFPKASVHSSVAGYQPKLALVSYEGGYYLPGGTPPELRSRWMVCGNLAQQFAAKSLESKSGKRARMEEVNILDQYCARAMTMGSGTDEEPKWVIRRSAAMLGWPAPPTSLEPDVLSGRIGESEYP